MSMPGYAGRILYINLSSREVRKEPLDPELVERFIGGWGINLKLAYDLIPPDVDPLSPQNGIIIGNGPFVGTMIPGAGKTMITSRYPLNGAFCASAGGGQFSLMLKSSGYDHLFINGRADRPVYLRIKDEEAELCDASDLWGKDSFETVDELRLRYEPCSIIPIGQAGENLVKISVTQIDRGGTVGSGGFPAVMGSKNLKAIVAQQGTEPIRVADRAKLQKLIDDLLKRVARYHPRDEMLKGGSMAMTLGVADNWRSAKDASIYYSNEFEPLSEQGIADLKDIYEIHKQSRRKIACSACPVSDKDRIDLTEGEWQGKVTYDSAVMAFEVAGGKGIEGYTNTLKEADATNRYNICRLNFRNTLAFLTHLYQKGIITKQDTGGIELRLNMPIGTVLKLLKMTAYRQGFGSIIAEGILGAAQQIGKGAETYAQHIKGWGFFWDPRLTTMGTMEFALLVYPPFCHVRAGGLGSAGYNPGRDTELWTKEAKREGVPSEVIETAIGPAYINVGRLTRYTEDFFSLFNLLGQCHRLYINRFYSIDLIAELYQAVTGKDKTPAELMRMGEKAWNMFKMLQVRTGFNRKDDEPPDCWFTPLKVKGIEGEEVEHHLMDYCQTKVLAKEDVDSLLDEYYAERGWDIKQGIPTPQKLDKLELKELLTDAETALGK